MEGWVDEVSMKDRGALLGERKGIWWASMVPVGGFKVILVVRIALGDLGLGMCLPVGFTGLANRLNSSP